MYYTDVRISGDTLHNPMQMYCSINPQDFAYISCLKHVIPPGILISPIEQVRLPPFKQSKVTFPLQSRPNCTLRFLAKESKRLCLSSQIQEKARANAALKHVVIRTVSGTIHDVVSRKLSRNYILHMPTEGPSLHIPAVRIRKLVEILLNPRNRLRLMAIFHICDCRKSSSDC